MITAFDTDILKQKHAYLTLSRMLFSLGRLGLMILLFLASFLFASLLFITASYAQTVSQNGEAQDNDFSLLPIIQLPTADNNKHTWQQLIAHPVNAQQYYARNKQNEIYLLEQEITGHTKASMQLLLDFKQLSLTSSSIKTLNTFTLHPNFYLKDQQGFATFYTAHTESTHKDSPTKRLQERNANLSVSFDGVITEWQLHLTSLTQVNLDSKREVLRITLPNASNGIKQLSFNPYSKSWNDNFALLYIALDATDSLSQFPLYSGTILRINPQKFGMKSFTVPTSNPFLKDDTLHNSFYLVGAQHIQQFLWPDKNTEQLLISHQYVSHRREVKNNQQYQWFSLSEGGEDWREQAPNKVLYKSYKHLSNNQVVFYRGRNVPALHNKLLILQNHQDEWQINSLSNVQQVTESNTKMMTPVPEWQLAPTFSATSSLQFYINNKAELLFFQQDPSAIFELFQHNITPNKADESGSNGTAYFLFILIFMGIVGYGFYQVKVNKKSAKSLVRRQYANMSLDKEAQLINLFKRHKKIADKSIALNEISQCDVLLGDSVIATVNNSENNGFNDQKEQSVRDLFHREHTEKMIDGKVRRISMTITDINNHQDVICLYLRKGSDRITKRSYYQVIDDLLDWCWLISSKINAEHTSNRKPKPIISATEKALFEHMLHDETPLHEQAATIRPAIRHNEQQNSSDNIVEPKVAELKVTEPKLAEQLTENSSDNPEKVSSGLVDSELVNALEKLVKLKQQGFLSDDEFTKAKAKLLKNLMT